MRIAGLILLMALVPGCRPQSQPARSDSLALLPPGDGQPSVSPLGQPSSRAGECVSPGMASVSVRGELRREVHLGPPGYGETPKKDARDTIVVLVLPSPLAVCVDAQSGADTATIYRATELQLRGASRTVLDHLGSTVTAFGRLSEAVWGWEYTRIVLRTDSIPELREKLPGKRASATSPNEALLLAAWGRVAADSLRSRAATIMKRRSRAPRR